MMVKTQYKLYSKYKPSGVEWIREIPDGWEVKRLRWCLLYGKSGMRIGPFGSSLKLDIMVDDGINVYGQENVIASDYSLGKRKITDDKFQEMKSYEVFPDDILLSMMGSTGNFSRVPKNVEKGIIDSHLLRIRFQNFLDLSYFIYMANYSSSVSQQIEAIGKGSIMHGLNSSLVKQLILFLPPIPEQRAIADFLDRETARINGIVGKQTRMIELLKEKRSVLITQAVTKGLNPKVKMKPSGAEWIGEIPEGWEVRRLKWVIAGRLKYGANESAELDDPNLPRYIRITDFDDSGLIRRETFKSLPHEKAEGYYLSEGDILFARSGATVGKTFQFKNYKGKACFAGYLIKATPKTGLMHSDFLSYFTKSNSYESWKNAIFIQATIQNIGADKYHVLQIPLPSLPEQHAIADFLDRETIKVDKMVGKIEKQIELLNEYKQSLITHAVTGKIDVRDEINAKNT